MLEDEAISLEKVFPSPYSGILFLYLDFNLFALKARTVSVPLFGDSFFIELPSIIEVSYQRFRPLIRGFFFYVSS